MPGLTIGSGISGSLDAKNIVLGVLQKAVELSNLQAILGATVPVPELTATIPVCTVGSVTEDVDEMVTTDIEGGTFSNVDFSLKKDRVKLAVSDEAGLKSRAGDPLDIQIAGAGAELARILDKKIVAALEVTPQTGAAAGLWSTVTVNPLVDLGTAVAAILPYKADFCVMPSAVWAQYLKNDYVKNISTGNPAALQGAVGRVPGLNLDIFVNSNCTAKSVTVGAYCYIDDLYNGTNKITALDTWDEGMPSPIMFEQLGDAAAVWAIPTNALGTQGTTGKKLIDSLTTNKFLALKG